MKKFLLSLLILIATLLCGIGLLLFIPNINDSSTPETLSSPNGKYILNTEISGIEAGPSRRFCVKLILVNTTNMNKLVYQTGASDRMKWAIGWYDNDTIVLQSSDIGPRTYKFSDTEIKEISPSKLEYAFAKQLYTKKYK